MTTILAIDPGTTRSAWVVLNGDTVQWYRIDPNELLLAALRNVKLPVDRIVIEMVESYGMRFVGAETYETCVWIGRYIEAAGAIPVDRLTRSDVKLHLLGARRGKDPDVRAALLQRYGGREAAVGRKASPGPLFGVSADCWSALAVAVTWADRQKAAA